MPRPAKLDLAKRINSLQVERKRLQGRLQEIDTILGQARQALGIGAGSQPDSTAMAEAPKAARGRRRRSFAVNGLQSVLSFVQKHKGATTAEINANWAAEGRAGRADVTLGKLVAEKKLKRVKLKEGRGSRYQVA